MTIGMIFCRPILKITPRRAHLHQSALTNPPGAVIIFFRYPPRVGGGDKQGVDRMDPTARADAIHRLKSVAGHVNGIIRMLEEDRYCIDVIGQIQAAQTALSRVSEGILDAHLRTCVTTAIQGADAEERERVLGEITEVFRHTNRP